MIKEVVALDKNDLYKRTGWFSRDCQTLLDNLHRYNLAIVDITELVKANIKLEVLDDDLK